jgi:NAD-dependent aldehyde dehydrogenases
MACFSPQVDYSLFCWVQKYKLGDPTQLDTNLGPVVSLASAEKIRKQVADAGEFAV